MDFKKIEAFISIVETGSITNAAEKLYISQSTLSDRLTSLEEELGAKLILRGPGNKQLELTEKGIDFLDFAARYLELNKEVEDWKQNRQHQQLKVSAPQTVNAYLLRDFYKEYLKEDRLHLDISSHWNRTIYNMVYSSDTDIGIVSRPYQSKQVITEALIEEPLFVVYDKRYANYTHLNQLEKKDQIYIGWGPTYEDWYNEHWDSNTLPKVTLDSPDLLISYLESTKAWAIVPLCMFQALKVFNERIEEVRKNIPIKRSLYLIYQKGISDARNHIIEAFIQDIYYYVLYMEAEDLCKVLMKEPKFN